MSTPRSNAHPFTTVRELPTVGFPGFSHPEWDRRFPWLVQGTTGRGKPDAPFDLGIFGAASPASVVLEHWEALRVSTGLERAVHARQVHGAAVRFHRLGPPGLHLADACDGHATADAGVLLAVSTADCVPVSVVDPTRPAVAVVHAGWRGAAAGVLERGVAVLVERTGAPPGDLFVHLGPAICGACYEVGPEVFESLGLDPPDAPAPLDLREALARRAVAAGVDPGRVTISEHCTLCGDGTLFSHRGGDRERQVGYLGIRA